MTAPKIIIDVKNGGIIGSSVQPLDQHDIKNRGVKVSFGHQGTNFIGMRTLVGTGTKGQGNTGDITFDTWEHSTSTSREVMRINGTGNVGIGTDKPNAKLFINSNASDPATVGTNALTIGSSNPDDGRLQMGISKGYSWIQSHGAKPLIINKHNTVGIGTTSPTQAKLVVSGSVNHTPKFLRQDIFGGKFYQDEIINKLTTSNSKIPYSIYASNHVAAQQFYTFSDSRIKNIVGLSYASKD
jgi:hypothetical protein